MRYYMFSCLLAFAIFSTHAEDNKFIINTMGVRLRSDSGISAKIIQKQSKDEIGTYTDKIAVEDDPLYSVFYWFSVSIRGKTGWIYGEFIDLSEDRLTIKKNEIANSNEIQIRSQAGRVYVGIKEEDLLKVLGKPDRQDQDTIPGVTIITFLNGGIYIEYEDGMQCVKYIKITDPRVMLASGIHVGMSIEEILASNPSSTLNMKDGSISARNIYAPTYNMWYSPWLSIDYDENKLVTAIYVGLNIE